MDKFLGETCKRLIKEKMTHYCGEIDFFVKHECEYDFSKKVNENMKKFDRLKHLGEQYDYFDNLLKTYYYDNHIFSGVETDEYVYYMCGNTVKWGTILNVEDKNDSYSRPVKVQWDDGSIDRFTLDGAYWNGGNQVIYVQ